MVLLTPVPTHIGRLMASVQKAKAKMVSQISHFLLLLALANRMPDRRTNVWKPSFRVRHRDHSLFLAFRSYIYLLRHGRFAHAQTICLGCLHAQGAFSEPLGRTEAIKKGEIPWSCPKRRQHITPSDRESYDFQCLCEIALRNTIILLFTFILRH